MDELLARHRKEARDLQSQITQKKKSASKKTRKSVNDACNKLEEELKVRHDQELAALQGSEPAATETARNGAEFDQDSLLDSLTQADVEHQNLEKRTSELKISTDGPTSGATMESSLPAPNQRKPNRQKARLARRAEDRQEMAALAASEAANLPDIKGQERQRMLKEFENRGLVEKEVAANGHCLYSAVADQMRQIGRALGPENGPLVAKSQPTLNELQKDDYKFVRAAAANYISDHPDDFVPFLDEPLDGYLHKVRDTGEWGGQLELLALAKKYSIDINVVQADGRVEKIESGVQGIESAEAWLAYYRHGFGLGEHYNSLRRKANSTQRPGDG